MSLTKIEFNDDFVLSTEEKNIIAEVAKQTMKKDSLSKFITDLNSDYVVLNLSFNDFVSTEVAYDFVACIYENIGVGAANLLYDSINYSLV